MSSPVKVGDVVDGKYRVERIVGEGGMGVVVEATHLMLEERVALKFLLTDHAGDENAAARFAREAKAAARLKSPHVARVTDVGTLHTGAAFLVMEYLEGSDLEEILFQRGPLSVEQAVGYVLQAAEGVAEAHRRGIVHRDLKPSNLYVASEADGTTCVKVLDFGIAKAMGERITAAKLTTTTVGSPGYASPEQLHDSTSVDGRSDIWSLGVILYELLTNEMPFSGQSIGQIVTSILSKPPVPLLERRPDVPPELAAIVHRCLEKDPAARFPHVGAFSQALSAFGPAGSRSNVERAMRLSIPDASISEPGMGTDPRLPAVRFEGRGPAGRTAFTSSASIPSSGARRRYGLVALTALGVMVVAVPLMWWALAEPVDPSLAAPESSATALPLGNDDTIELADRVGDPVEGPEAPSVEPSASASASAAPVQPVVRPYVRPRPPQPVSTSPDKFGGRK